LFSPHIANLLDKYPGEVQSGFAVFLRYLSEEKMRCIAYYIATALVAFGATLNAATFSFVTDPFAGSNALTTPGRQIVAGEPSISFSPSSDVFAFDLGVFGVSSLSFANNVIGSIPAAGVNVIVLETLDDDANPATAFGAGNAANLIAAQLTTPSPGFFVYFNSALNLPRLVYSTDLNDNTADLKILARMTNLTGQSSALQSFTSANFTAVPEPSSCLLSVFAAAVGVCVHRLRSRRDPAA
jgi:hypothetical protein